MATSQDRSGTRSPIDRYSGLKSDYSNDNSAFLSEKDGENGNGYGNSYESKKYSRQNTTYTTTKTKPNP